MKPDVETARSCNFEKKWSDEGFSLRRYPAISGQIRICKYFLPKKLKIIKVI